MIDRPPPGHWPQGEAEITDMIHRRELERVDPSPEHADLLIDQAAGHLSAAAPLIDHHPPSAFTLTYDAARKAMTAVLARQGLRPTTGGGHLAVQESIEAQLGPNVRHIVRPFRTMRRRRNESEYPRIGEAPVTVTECRHAHCDVTAIVEHMTKSLAQVGPW
ncbi:hypothetical protein GCG21_02040 [Pseudactinotalea sp. HY160]|uniref:hypothetical protein n=1 Tax=Pseudactinotalea sp. HY160 TaxID=2654490 RepID=UPI00128BC4BE|nr:hypothetical protein [Pseudactinotalea sp. HY160]MPV48810.1 hypothetical protein [Pseudactinotalea sp. HY160]